MGISRVGLRHHYFLNLHAVKSNHFGVWFYEFWQMYSTGSYKHVIKKHNSITHLLQFPHATRCYNPLFVSFLKPQVMLQDRVAEHYCSRPVVFSQRCAPERRTGFLQHLPTVCEPHLQRFRWAVLPGPEPHENHLVNLIDFLSPPW